MLQHLTPAWPKPHNIRAFTSIREGGYSKGPYTSLNLAMHVDDNPSDVIKNREKLQHDLALPSTPVWLNQQHGTHVVIADQVSDTPEADASFTTKTNTVCAILTADCLPLLMCTKTGDCVAAIHAGWKGLSAGIIEATIEALPCLAQHLMVWLGPAIGPKTFELGTEVREQFLQWGPEAKRAFIPISHDKWLANIYLLAKQRLTALGVRGTDIYGGEECTYSDNKRFFSYRRTPITGRMASVIWINDSSR